MNAFRVVAPAKNEIEIEEFSLATPTGNEVLIETIYTTISPGTELAWLQHQASTPGVYPWYPGYSGVGRIVSIGASVQGLRVGRIVACNIPHSSHVVIDASLCHAVKEGIDVLEASAFRLVSIALQGVRKAQIQLGESVAVLGLGPIGILAGQLARASGATFVGGVDLLEHRRQLATQSQFDAASEAAASDAFDVVIEATGVPEVINSAFKVAKQRGRVVLLGSPRGITDGIDFYTDVHRKGIQIIGAHEINRTGFDERLHIVDFEDEEIALALLADGRLKLRPLISEVIKPEGVARAYQRLAARDEDLVLVAIDWQQS